MRVAAANTARSSFLDISLCSVLSQASARCSSSVSSPKSPRLEISVRSLFPSRTLACLPAVLYSSTVMRGHCITSPYFNVTHNVQFWAPIRISAESTNSTSASHHMRAGLLEAPEYGSVHVFDYEEYWPAEKLTQLQLSLSPALAPAATSPTGTGSAPSSAIPVQQPQAVAAKAASTATQSPASAPAASTK